VLLFWGNQSQKSIRRGKKLKKLQSQTTTKKPTIRTGKKQKKRGRVPGKDAIFNKTAIK